MNAALLRFWSDLKRYMIAGITAVLPLTLTIYIVFLIFRFTDNLAGQYIAPLLERYSGITVWIPGLGFITLLALIILAGYISTRLIGRRLFQFLDRLLKRTPLVAKIYPSVKQLSDFLFTFKKENLQQVAYIEFPCPGAYSLVFIIKEDIALAGRQGMVNVFIPFAPTPLSGLVLLMPKDKVCVLDVSVEDTIKYFFSAGVVSPAAFPLKKEDTSEGSL
ncbi:MAG: DUF502 domain-containing protein [Deltaproteobacteria bacterium]